MLPLWDRVALPATVARVFPVFPGPRGGGGSHFHHGYGTTGVVATGPGDSAPTTFAITTGDPSTTVTVDEWINSLRAKPWPSKVIPTFSMDQARLFRLLIREYLFVSLYRAFAESLASENASRLVSMQVAEKNIEERLNALTAESRQVRQSSIASELLDIIASFEALRDKDRYR